MLNDDDDEIKENYEPWVLQNPKLNTKLTSLIKETSPIIYKANYYKLLEEYQSSSMILTNSSKTSSGTHHEKC